MNLFRPREGYLDPVGSAQTEDGLKELATRAGDGIYFVNDDGPTEKWLRVQDGKVVPPELNDPWELYRILGELPGLQLRGLYPRSRTLYVVEPGQLAQRYALHKMGTCLARKLSPGDRILDVLCLSVLDGRLKVLSELAWMDPCSWVTLLGRAPSWGSLGDDSFDEGSAHSLLESLVLEAWAAGSCEESWSYAPVYYIVQSTENETSDVLLEIDLARHPRFRFEEWWLEAARRVVEANLPSLYVL